MLNATKMRRRETAKPRNGSSAKTLKSKRAFLVADFGLLCQLSMARDVASVPRLMKPMARTAQPNPTFGFSLRNMIAKIITPRQFHLVSVVPLPSEC